MIITMMLIIDKGYKPLMSIVKSNIAGKRMLNVSIWLKEQT